MRGYALWELVITLAFLAVVATVAARAMSVEPPPPGPEPEPDIFDCPLTGGPTDCGPRAPSLDINLDPEIRP